MTKNEQAKQAAIADLKQHIHEGDTIYTVTRHRSASGMYRAIDCYLFRNDTIAPAIPTRIIKLRITGKVSTALGYRYDKKHEAIGIGGAGHNADEQIVSDLSYALFGSVDKLRKEEI